MSKTTEYLGRREELAQLKSLANIHNSSLVAIMGRRRIGKSRLVREHARNYKYYYEFQGLYPAAGVTRQDQLNEFAEDLSRQFHAPRMQFDSWTQAFQELAHRTSGQKCLILFDEISWMSHQDPLFSSQLQKAWNTLFSLNSKLMLVLCGSVSSWIEENILESANFVGRVSLQIKLNELALNEVNKFWLNQGGAHVSAYEKLKILAIAGGVPKYLEELVYKATSEQAIITHCFQPGGFLFNDFTKIFSEIFMRKAPTLEKIVRDIAQRKLTANVIASHLKLPLNSVFSKNIRMLELSGFCHRDYSYHPDGERAKINYVRLSDNYLRFYLKYIEPLTEKIESRSMNVKNISQIGNWESILGLQFENLILNSRNLIFPILNLDAADIISAAPYAQKASTRNKGSTQVDLLIHSKRDVFFLCELKTSPEIDKKVIKEVAVKMDRIKISKRASIRPVLIYEGALRPNDEQALRDFFDTLIPFESLLDMRV